MDDKLNHEFSDDGSPSVTEWLQDLKQGDQRAAQQIFDRYMSQLIRVAHRRLQQRRRGVADEEDVVSIAFTSFLKQVDTSGFSKLDDRKDLWQILFMLTDRKAIDLIRRESAKIRGEDKTFGESIFETIDDTKRPTGINSASDRNPSPEYAAILTEEFAIRISVLNAQQQQIAIDKMQGLTNSDIATKRGMSLRSVERKLREIRDLWQDS